MLADLEAAGAHIWKNCEVTQISTSSQGRVTANHLYCFKRSFWFQIIFIMTVWLDSCAGLALQFDMLL